MTDRSVRIRGADAQGHFQGIARGIVRPDLDICYTAFLIHSLSLIFMASLAPQHFQIRFKEYLEIRQELGPKSIQKTMQKMVHFIHQLPRPSGPSAPKNKRPRGTNLRRRKARHV
jgi:hypothetical protein